MTPPARMPVCLNIQGEPCLVVGGGRVAWRKISVLKKFGADITCISPEFIGPIKQLGRTGRIRCVKAFYSGRTALKKYVLVFAATDDSAVNKRIAAAAIKRKIPVNVVDQSVPGTLIMPAVLKRKNFVIGVSTGGRSPGDAKALRDRLNRLLSVTSK
jgi:siroheme synthase-like protein